MDKVCRIGKGECGNVYVRIEHTDNRLSITGVEGPMRNGKAKGSCGQIVDHLNATEYAPGWNAETVAQLQAYWREWHLNAMQAGSPRQTAWLKANPVKAVYPESHYDKASAALASAGLNPDLEYVHNGKPYMYGHAWLKVDVPANVLEWFAALPDTDIKPAWV